MHPSEPSAQEPFIVGIGASAGGLPALRAFFSQVPADSGLAYVVVVHLAPDQESRMAELLQTYSAIPVQRVTATIPIHTDHVYVIPPGANLNTIDTHLRLSELERRRSDRSPIDHFLRTLTQTHSDRAIGVILTGAGSDGALGIKELKEKGGLTIAQDPEEAEFDGMPSAAIATEMIDLVLPVAEIPEAILSYLATRPNIHLPREDDQPDSAEQQLLHKVFAQIRYHTGRDFRRYKRSTILRRIQRRMQLYHLQQLNDYLQLLQDQPQEVTTLADEFLVTVTNFFRDPQAFDDLAHAVIPGLFRGRATDDPVRVWSVGCATGEEAYSLGMLLLEEAERHPHPPSIQLFASDLHTGSLRRAREGFYTDTISADVSQKRLQRFFQSEDNGYRVSKALRQIMVFASHDLLTDPPFSRLDLIVCRNMLIYLRREVQREVMDIFHFALNPQGRLFLGLSETVDRSDLFQAETGAQGIYQRRETNVQEHRHLPLPLREQRDIAPPSSVATVLASLSPAELHLRLVERYAPPSLLVDQNHHVIHCSEHVGRYLAVPGGEPSVNIFKLVREELRTELRTLLYAAPREAHLLQSQPLALEIDGQSTRVIIQVQPPLQVHHENCSLVVFVEQVDKSSPPVWGTVVEGSPTTEATAHELATELDLAKHRLQTMVEEYETSQEKMRTTNEELQSSNEELCSMMEELETSKEELQSMNEELSTLNQENHDKVEELATLSDHLQNLLNATSIATVFLDMELRILRFTPPVANLLRVRSMDIGRSLADISHILDYPDLVSDASSVLSVLAPQEREIKALDDSWFLTRLLPYHGVDDQVAGVVITFVDISDRKQAEQALLAAKDYAERIVETIREPLLLLDAEQRIRSANRAFYEHFQTTCDQTEGRRLFELGNGQWDIPVLHTLLAEILPRDRVVDDFLVEYDFPNLGQRSILVSGCQVDYLNLILLSLRDITDQQRTAQDLREANRRKDEFLATLAHELRNPLAPIRSALAVLRRSNGDLATAEELQIMMERQISYLVRLVDDLLDTSRINQGRIELRREAVTLNHLLHRAVEYSRPVLEEKGHHFQAFLPNESLALQADPVRLIQIINNLLTNAAKYTPARGEISLRVTREGQQVVITVKDNGIGVDETTLPQVFDIFFRGNHGEDRHHYGLGVGLSLVKTLTELHGGSVSVASPGRNLGSEFTVRLPIADEIFSAPEAVEAPPEVSTSDDTPRILVVDDNQDAATSLAMLLELLGATVQTAPDGPMALTAVMDFAPETIFLDIGLPGMDGYQVARRIREHYPERAITLIALTGWGRDEDQQRAWEAGFDHHLTKPVDTTAVKTLLRGSESPPP